MRTSSGRKNADDYGRDGSERRRQYSQKNPEIAPVFQVVGHHDRVVHYKSQRYGQPGQGRRCISTPAK